MIDIFHRMNRYRKIPEALRQRIFCEVSQYKPCIENALLPRTIKLAIQPTANPNIAVTLQVMNHIINDRQNSILVMLGTGDKMMHISLFGNETDEKPFKPYFSYWISIFDTPIYIVVDSGTNLATQYVADQLRDLQSQLFPIPTEVPWSFGRK